jgi:hypothetical protein
MEIEPSYFSIIPADVRYDKKLPPNAKLLYGEITALCSKKGYCWSRNNYFAELYRVDKSTVSGWISLLEKRGHIRTALRHNNMRRIYLKGIKIEQGPLQKSKGGLYKNRKPPLQKSKALYSSTKNSKKNTVACKQADLAFKVADISVYKDYSLRLLKIVGSHRKVMRRPLISNWAKQFKILHTKDGIRRKDIRKTLTWYKKNIGQEYVPDVRSAKSFRQKFDKLRAAMDRDAKNIKKGAKQTIYKTNKKKKRRVLG